MDDDFLVLNGDTLFDIDFNQLSDFHCNHHNNVTLALRKVDNTERYGAVQTKGNFITAFCEKQGCNVSGLINGGIYAIHRAWLQQLGMPTKFSFEKDILQALVTKQSFCGLAFNNYFIDIGIPDDYSRAQREFNGLFPKDTNLFLDRDGVLNRRIEGDYVRSWSQWEWLPNAKEAIARLSQRYKHVFIVTNQQGIGKGLFSMADVDDIHHRMLSDIEAFGGHIDRVYVCPDIKESNSANRKPAIGMALQACADYPDVELTDSVMIGDSLSDIQFGYAARMRCVYLNSGNPTPIEIRNYTDIIYSKV